MILDRYVLRLWLAPFIAGLVLVTGVLLFGRALKLLALMTDSGAPWSLLGELMVFVLPYFILLTVPIAFFLSMQNVVAALQQGSEIDVMRSAGMSYTRICRSVIGMAIILYAALFYISMYILPQGQLAFNNVLTQIYNLKGSPEFTPQRFSRGVEDITFYVEGKGEDGRYHGVMLEDGRPGGPVFYLAETAELVSGSSGLRLNLHQGTRLEGKGDNQRMLAFTNYDVDIPLGHLGTTRLSRSTDHVIMMSPSQLWQRIQQHHAADAVAEWMRRIVLPTTVLILCAFGLPLSLAPKRSGRTGSFLLGIGLLILLYNVQLVLHRQVSMGTFPAWSMWAGQLGFLCLGLLLWHRAEQGRLPMWLVQGGEMFYLIHRRLMHWIAHRLGKS
ncbi:MAG: LptF/LptG family permease [Mariprofundaceae bacterium]|nr:LptF/LptG family permease [Mariprofundaceae bacterium]